MVLEHWHGFLDDQIALRPDARAVSDSTGADWTYRALDAACVDIGSRLKTAGVRPGDRVMVLIENCAAAMAAVFAASRIGAIAVPVNARQTQTELKRILNHARPRVVLFTTSSSHDARAHADAMNAEEISGAFGTLHLATPFESSPDDLPDVAVLLYTTGTTGTPKGVMLTHQNLRFGAKTSATLRDMVHEDRIYGVLPITHVFGLTSITTAATFAGAHVHFEARFSAEGLYNALSSGITLFSGVPQMHALLMQYAKERGHRRLPTSDLRYVSSGAAPLDPAWKRKAEAFYGVALQNGYGMTETTAGVSITKSVLGDPDVSCGPALPGVEIEIDAPSSDGVGEIRVRGDVVMKGYYKNPEASEAVLSADGWLKTGDLGLIDDQARIHIVGRAKELIIHGGFNVYPPEVEAALNDHPKVIQCAVIGRPKNGDEEVLAFVQAAPDDLPESAELVRFAAERLAGYKRPKHIVVATDLPAAPTGKILKHKLLEAFEGHLP